MAVFVPDANLIVDTLSDPNFLKPENTAVCDPGASETSIFNINDRETDHAEKQPMLFTPNFFANFYFDQFSKYKNFNNFKNKIYIFHVYQFWPMIGLSHVHTNLGRRGHRFCMTLESRISRFKS